LLRLVFALFLTAAFLTAQPLPTPRTLADAEKLEIELDAKPGDLAIRGILLRFYSDPALGAESAKPLRRKHILWLIENKSDAALLSQPTAALERSGSPLADPDGYAEADALWRKYLSGGNPPSADGYANAIHFFKLSDPPFARKLADDGLAAYPNNARLANSKGTLLAFTILGVKQVDRYDRASALDDDIAKSAEASRARKELEDTTSANLLGGTAAALHQHQSPQIMLKRAEQMKEIDALVEHLYERAIELDPKNQRWASGLGSVYWTSASRKLGTEKIALLEKALRLVGDVSPRSYILPDLAQEYFKTGNLELAAARAQDCLIVAQKESDPNHGGALHFGNIVLGRIALKNGDIEEAKRRLLAAGNTTSTPVLMSFGPNWDLAKDLLAKGEQETVLAYIDLCRKFWQSGATRLDTWAAAIRNGGLPDFLGTPALTAPQFVGKTAPDFRLKRLKGGELSLAEFKDKIVVLDFWATWCAPCRQEMPDFEKLHREYAGKDVVILAIDVNEEEDVVSGYIDKEKFTFPVLLATGTDVVARYTVNAYPTTFAVDKSGRIADIILGSGPNSETRIRQAIDRARAGAPPLGQTALPLSSVRPAAIPAPVTAEDFVREGVRLHAAKDLTGAVSALDRALQLNSRMAVAYELRGHANYDLRHFPQAIADFTRSLDLSPNQPVAYNGRGAAYLDSGKIDEALADLNRALELNPTYAPALQHRSRLYLQRKQYTEAIADCDAALRMNPSLTWASDRKSEIRGRMSGVASSVPAPNLLSPAPGTVFGHFPRDTMLVWSEVPGAASYVVEWDYKGTDAWASEQRGTQGALIRTSQPVANFKFIGAQTGRWRVWAVDAAGLPGPKSDWREFSYTH
jgi:tetratricopeptide (TPR) repeat protein